MACVILADPGVRVETADGFVWKPVSEGQPPNAVVLFPAGSATGPATINGVAGYYRGLTNGGRPTTYFPQTGSAYPLNSEVCPGGGDLGDTDSPDNPVLEVEFDFVEDSSIDFSFDEEGDDIRVFPPLPIRTGNVNYYSFDDEQKIKDIELLSRTLGLRADTIIDLVMDSPDVEGSDDMIDNVFINFGTRIHDNSAASCRYIYKFLNYIIGYGNEYGGGLSEFTDCGVKPILDVDGQEIDPDIFTGQGEVFHGISHCNVFTVKTDDYYSEFTFSHIDVEVKSIQEILADPIMGEQYRDREKRVGSFWYISSSAGDISDEEDYEQPDGENENVPYISFGECNGEFVTLVTVYSPGGTVVITDFGSGMAVTRVLNSANVNSVLIPYIPSIGEQLTNNELADNFLTSLQVSIYVANWEIVKTPWWLTVIKIVGFIVTMVMIAYGDWSDAAALQTAIIMTVGYLTGLAIYEIAKNWGAIAGIIALVVITVLTKGATGNGGFTGLITGISNMSLSEILFTVLNMLIKSVEIVQNSDVLGLTDDISSINDETEYYRDEITKLEDSQKDDRKGGFVGIEPLLEPLLNVSIRTEVNPMDPSTYFDMYDDFHNIGFELQDYDRMFEDPFDFDNMLQPA